MEFNCLKTSLLCCDTDGTPKMPRFRSTSTSNVKRHNNFFEFAARGATYREPCWLQKRGHTSLAKRRDVFVCVCIELPTMFERDEITKKNPLLAGRNSPPVFFFSSRSNNFCLRCSARKTNPIECHMNVAKMGMLSLVALIFLQTEIGRDKLFSDRFVHNYETGEDVLPPPNPIFFDKG